ncbi:hypothetical protein [Methylobacter sp. YRD-M1]|uniref:hypothetical protein n=1 Tax=Methylobacter sp. YRD-M1 TaxID=2911520 RepID=UPI00227CE51C|nr:hypothetical protein [Methylobacter sp. YRD-M1]WAK02511.1 hypothetical protein LZ558_01610 [Methylobacter sp. YRD-M1]
MLFTCLTGICAADPVATLIASPCGDRLNVEDALRWELSRHNWVSRGWTVRQKGSGYEVSQSAAVNKMSDISFTWLVENNTVTPTSPASLALCGPR